MKRCFPILVLATSLGLTACGSFSEPLETTGSFDPLNTAGSGGGSLKLANTSAYKPGQFVITTVADAAFFKSKPKGNVTADKLLKQGASMKVISNSGSYVKVELDSGDIGFVSAVMLQDASAATSNTRAGREFQVYPPLPTGGGSAAPLPNPSGGPLPDAIPPVIDPEAPAVTPNNIPPVVEPTPTTEVPVTPAPTAPTATPESVPLPPAAE